MSCTAVHTDRAGTSALRGLVFSVALGDFATWDLSCSIFVRSEKSHAGVIYPREIITDVWTSLLG